MDDRLLFGKKYFGWPLRCIPCSYFRWMREKIPAGELDPDVQEAVLREFERRKCGCPNSIPPDPHEPARDPGPGVFPPGYGRHLVPKEEVASKVRRWYHDLAAQFHPDKRHGNTEAMTAVNVAHDKLKKVLDIN